MSFKIKYLVLLVFLFFSFVIHAQNPCEKVYSSTEVELPAESPLKPSDFFKFVEKEIAPILSKNETLVTKLLVLFTISEKGEIVTVEFPNLETKKTIHEELAKAFMQMGKWKPATLNKKKVCSEFSYPIACLKWQ